MIRTIGSILVVERDYLDGKEALFNVKPRYLVRLAAFLPTSRDASVHLPLLNKSAVFNGKKWTIL